MQKKTLINGVKIFIQGSFHLKSLNKENTAFYFVQYLEVTDISIDIDFLVRIDDDFFFPQLSVAPLICSVYSDCISNIFKLKQNYFEQIQFWIDCDDGALR